MKSGWAAYDAAPDGYFEQYEARSFEEIHASWLTFLPPTGRALDVGAGSGRDAAGLASRGFAVTAVEPSRAMLERAMRRHPGLEWIESSLPALEGVGPGFDLVLVSAVWMFLREGEAGPAMRSLAMRLNDGGRLVLAVRTGELDAARGMRAVPAEEPIALAEAEGLSLLTALSSADVQGRPGVGWRTYVFERPSRNPR